MERWKIDIEATKASLEAKKAVSHVDKCMQKDAIDMLMSNRMGLEELYNDCEDVNAEWREKVKEIVLDGAESFEEWVDAMGWSDLEIAEYYAPPSKVILSMNKNGTIRQPSANTTWRETAISVIERAFSLLMSCLALKEEDYYDPEDDERAYDEYIDACVHERIDEERCFS